MQVPVSTRNFLRYRQLSIRPAGWWDKSDDLQIGNHVQQADEQSQSDTIPAIVIKNDNVDLGHEAKIGRISDEAIFYLMSRGLSEDEARAMLVRGFVEPVSKALPLEYAVEMNNLINLELKGSM